MSPRVRFTSDRFRFNRASSRQRFKTNANLKDGDMKTSLPTQDSNQQKKHYPTSSVGLAYSDGVVNLDSTAERIKNCLIVADEIHVLPLTFVVPDSLEPVAS